jgi:hypothetical protein
MQIYAGLVVEKKQEGLLLSLRAATRPDYDMMNAREEGVPIDFRIDQVYGDLVKGVYVPDFNF